MNHHRDRPPPLHVIEADQIAVIEDGQVVELGSPEELLARGGRLADLYGRWLAGAA